MLGAVRELELRVQWVGLFPTALAMAVITLFVLGNAPNEPLSIARAQEVGRSLGVGGGVALAVISAAISLTLQPLQFRLVQLMEGYWQSRLMAIPYRLGIKYQRRRLQRMERRLATKPSSNDTVRLARAAQRQLVKDSLYLRMPREEAHLMPTALGNVLRAMEQRAGARYGIESISMWPRLHPVLPVEYSKGLEREVGQLDVSVRLAVTWFCTGVGLLAFIARDPVAALTNRSWLWLIALVFFAGWLSYRAAIESALAHSGDVEVTFDVYRDLLLESARFVPAPSLQAEMQQFATLAKLYQAEDSDHGINFRLVQRRDMASDPS
jgi:hypothetical protein